MNRGSILSAICMSNAHQILYSPRLVPPVLPQPHSITPGSANWSNHVCTLIDGASAFKWYFHSICCSIKDLKWRLYQIHILILNTIKIERGISQFYRFIYYQQTMQCCIIDSHMLKSMCALAIPVVIRTAPCIHAAKEDKEEGRGRGGGGDDCQWLTF